MKMFAKKPKACMLCAVSTTDEYSTAEKKKGLALEQ